MKRVPKNNRAKIQARELRLPYVAKYYGRGYTIRQIRDAVALDINKKTLSISTIHEDLKILLKELHEQQQDSMLEGLEVALERNRDLLHEAWQNYRRSRGVLDEENEEQAVEQGDVKALELINKLHQERNKLLGLYAPEKKELSGDISFASLLVESGIDE